MHQLLLLQFRFDLEHLLLEVVHNLVALVFLEGHLVEYLDELLLVFVCEVLQQDFGLFFNKLLVSLLLGGPLFISFLLPKLPVFVGFANLKGVAPRQNKRSALIAATGRRSCLFRSIREDKCWLEADLKRLERNHHLSILI